MQSISTIGLDIAKSVFQVHGVDGAGLVVIRKRIGRAKMLEYFGGLPRCLVGIEACPSAHQVAACRRGNGRARKHGTGRRPWLGRLMERRPRKWRPSRSPTRLHGWPGAIMVRNERYKEPKLLLAA